jgi:hypothetical protein
MQLSSERNHWRIHDDLLSDAAAGCADVPSSYLLVIEARTDCTVVDNLDSRIGWSRDHPVALQTDPETATVASAFV